MEVEEGDNIIGQEIKELNPFVDQLEEERDPADLERIERERQAAAEQSRLRREQREQEDLERQNAEQQRLRQRQQVVNVPPMNAEQEIKAKISDFLLNDKKSLVDEIEELKIQLRKKYLSQKAIEEEKIRIASRIFYFPTKELVNAIRANGKDHEVVLFKSIALKHGDLQEYKNNFGAEIKHITENVVNWGNLYFDIKKLEESATRKTGGMLMKTYELDPYELEVTLTPKQSNSVTVKHKGSVTSQNEFREVHLERIAEERLREVATRMYYDYTKKDQFI